MQSVLRDSCQKTTTWELGEGPSAEYLSVQGMVSGGTEGKTEEKPQTRGDHRDMTPEHNV